MDDQSSLSKGCFIYKPKQAVNPFHEIKNEVWDQSFTRVWTDIEAKLKVHQDEMSSQLMNDLINFTKTATDVNSKIPTAVLLTGVNLPDHGLLFSHLVSKLKKEVSNHVAVLYPSSCSTLKNSVEIMAGQFMNADSPLDSGVSFIEEDSDEDESGKEYKRSICNMPNLVSWYKNKQNSTPLKKSSNSNPKLIVILPDFEGLPLNVIQKLLLILSCYVSKLPLVIVLGVATSKSVIGDMLEHSVTSKLSIELFQSQRSVHFLNNVLDEVFLTKHCPFQLGPNIFKFLLNTFLFYDFSVKKVTLGIKYCVMDHFFQQPFKILCSGSANLEKVVKKVTKNDLESIRQLDSYKTYLGKLEKEEQVSLSSDVQLKKTIITLLNDCYKRLSSFHICLRLLQILVSQLPGAPLGKQVRELYLAAMVGEISKSPAYKECYQLLNFQAKQQLLEKINQMICYINGQNYEGEIKSNLLEFIAELESFDFNPKTKSPRKIDVKFKSRAEFKEKLLSLNKKAGGTGGYEGVRERLVNYLMKEVFPTELVPVSSLPLHEIIVCDSKFNPNLKRNLVGCPRADIHHALTHPSDYLLCECCKLDDSSEISSTLPDISIVYKLHLECGALINLHDWLQAFATVIDPKLAKEEKMVISPLIQARFTQAVSDLEFMGFIRPSNRKADHVSRMTWGSSA